MANRRTQVLPTLAHPTIVHWISSDSSSSNLSLLYSSLTCWSSLYSSWSYSSLWNFSLSNTSSSDSSVTSMAVLAQVTANNCLRGTYQLCPWHTMLSTPVVLHQALLMRPKLADVEAVHLLVGVWVGLHVTHQRPSQQGLSCGELH